MPIYTYPNTQSHRQVASILARLAITFQRPVTAIHNPTYGPVFDFLLHTFMRGLPLSLPVHRALYEHLREQLLWPSVHKVMVLSHDTGSSILSCVLDQLHADLPTDVLAKLEIYTFGAAATHFSNPLVVLGGSVSVTDHDGRNVEINRRGERKEEKERVIPVLPQPCTAEWTKLTRNSTWSITHRPSP